jgi:hypothetical protein
MKVRRLTRLIIVIASCCVFASCTSLPDGANGQSNDYQYTTNSYKSKKVKEVVEDANSKRVLYVFDIDNTLLESPDGQLLGSAQWYDWQGELKDGDPKKVTCKLEMQGASYLIAHLESTESGYAATFLGDLQASGKDVIALTARGPEFRYPTERELSRNGFDFSQSLPMGAPGFPGSYLPKQSSEISKPRNASYQNGIVMLAGQHKGAGLIDILDRIGAEKAYDLIVFFDDDEKNTRRMMDSFRKDRRAAIVFDYTAVDTDFDQGDIEKALQGQNAISEAYAQFVQVPGCDL